MQYCQNTSNILVSFNYTGGGVKHKTFYNFVTENS